MTEMQAIKHVSNGDWLKNKDHEIRKQLTIYVNANNFGFHAYSGCWSKANMMRTQLYQYFVREGKLKPLHK